jgi:hypothetical protein
LSKIHQNPPKSILLKESFYLYSISIMARTLAQVQEEYTAVREAYLKALRMESYGIGGRNVSRPRAADLRKQVDQLAEEIFRLSNGGVRVIAITPMDS